MRAKETEARSGESGEEDAGWRGKGQEEKRTDREGGLKQKSGGRRRRGEGDGGTKRAASMSLTEEPRSDGTGEQAQETQTRTTWQREAANREGSVERKEGKTNSVPTEGGEKKVMQRKQRK